MSELDTGRRFHVLLISLHAAPCCNVFTLMTSSCVWAQTGRGQHDVMKGGQHPHILINVPSLLCNTHFLHSFSLYFIFCLCHPSLSFFLPLCLVRPHPLPLSVPAWSFPPWLKKVKRRQLTRPCGHR